jgi:hypothetical protein
MLLALLAPAFAAPAEPVHPVLKLITPSAGMLATPPARIATLIPLRPDDVRRVLLHKIGDWWGPSGRQRGQMSFDAKGGAVNGECDPASCEGCYVISGNRVTIDWNSGPSPLYFYMAANGLVYAAVEDERAKGVARPW